MKKNNLEQNIAIMALMGDHGTLKYTTLSVSLKILKIKNQYDIHKGLWLTVHTLARGF